MADRQSTGQTSRQSNKEGTTQSSSQSGGQQGGQQNAEQRADQERQVRTSRESGRGASNVGTGSEGQARGGRQRGTALTGNRQAQSSMLPALIANPWLMTNALMANPFGFAQAMSQEMDRLFSSYDDLSSSSQYGGAESGRGLTSASQQGRGGLSRWAPQVEVRQRGNELVVCADLPGVTPDDVDIEIEDGLLTISGERQQSSEDRQEGFYRSERSYGAFSRSIPLPEGVDEDQIHAQFEHGVLEVTVPLPQERQRARRVQIQAGGRQGAGQTQSKQESANQSQQSGQRSTQQTAQQSASGTHQETTS